MDMLAAGIVRRPNGLSPAEVRRYVQHLDDANSLFSLVHESFQLHYLTHRGVTQADIGTMTEHHRRLGQDALADMLQHVLLVGEGSCMILVNPTAAPHTELSKMIVLYARRAEDKYDVICATATQTKTLSKDKVACAMGGSIAMGGLGSVIVWAAAAPHPIAWGVSIAGTLACASAGKAAYDYNAVMENVVAGYICKELEDMGLIQLADDHVRLL
eukprot:TRINITY_DN35890_c0_g1_i1.p1 TRINITY_DN35890_c0_g1~~TRINITY_DN35890_c0_g1_i1.p1  ORF type:complete len:215 (-),score=38.70 TRINITY_DN35890_c0_g1_i1:212-856(-)